MPDSPSSGESAPEAAQEVIAQVHVPASSPPEAEDVSLQFKSVARNLAEKQDARHERGNGPPPTHFLQAYDSLFLQANQRFRSVKDEENLAVSYAAEWMLDNYYVIKQALRLIDENLPEKFYYQLPKLVSGDQAGELRVLALARALIVHERAHIDTSRLKAFVHAYEGVTPLTMGEIWALPVILRLGIIHALAQSVARLTGIKPGEIQSRLPLLDLGNDVPDDEVIANGILTLRALNSEDWKAFFESLSLVELILEKDPAGYYKGMDFETRDRYRKVVEAIAIRAGIDEKEVARQVIRLAQQGLEAQEREDGSHARLELLSQDDDSQPDETIWPGYDLPREGHVGEYLIGEGRRVLEKLLGFQPTPALRLGRWLLSHPTQVYLGSIWLITGLILAGLMAYSFAFAGGWLAGVVVLLLGLVPVLSIATSLVNWIVTLATKPKVLPKMDFSSGIPADSATLIVVPALLTSVEQIDSLAMQLELHMLRNTEAQIRYALLTDLTDAPEAHMPEDGALVAHAVASIERLNGKYGELFLLLHRERRWNPGEDAWIGWERKRGKLHELNRWILEGGNSPFALESGPVDFLPRVRYVITLDEDTILPRDEAQRLVATMAHPLNRPVFAEGGGASPGGKSQQVISGYTILQPRTEISPTSANHSFFTRIFSGDTGLDLYTRAVSDVYQDLFGEGIYVGKGIYDVRAFERSLQGCIPENTLLSHDLFEGIHGRAGLVTDIVLIEDYPSTYFAQVSRMNRWMRGDWQLLPWLMPRIPGADGQVLENDLSVIDRWKIFDNMRRSLVAPVLMIWFVLGWLWFPGAGWLWALVGAMSLGVPALTELIQSLLRLAGGESLSSALHPLGDSLVRWALALVFLPFEAMLNLDAIATTLYRMLVSHKKLLRWVTASQAAYLFGGETSLKTTWMRMVASSALVILLGVLVLLIDPGELFTALPLLAAWLVSPQIAFWISQPVIPETEILDESMQEEVRRLSRRTWLFFEQYLNPEDHWLPPDHFQESPLGVTAHRTSPTNIGLALLSVVGAHDMGYAGLLDTIARLQSVFETLERMERFRGHFLNWYDTRTLEPLSPGYVSTVDSGNLAACFIALGQACNELADSRLLRWESWQGLLDALNLAQPILEKLEQTGIKTAVSALQEQIGGIAAQVQAAEASPSEWSRLWLHLSTDGWQELDNCFLDLLEQNPALSAEDLRSLRLATQAIRRQLDGALREIALVTPWLPALEQAPRLFQRPDSGATLLQTWQDLLAGLPVSPRLGEVPGHCQAGAQKLEKLRAMVAEAHTLENLRQEALAWIDDLSEKLETASMTAKVLEIGFQEIERKGNEYVREMDFSFLFDKQRQVFHIGYNQTLGVLDNSYYDLLASEARIASLVAIAKGDIPQSHWLHLARPLTQVDRTRALLSWSGTMFEYLMPSLLLHGYEATLLDQTNHAVVRKQIEYAESKHVPWGISESGYYRFDANQFYQYQAFGVPGLGFKRGLAEDLVVAPYASLLALSLRPEAVYRNIEALKRYQMMGDYGLYEAVDFTPSRLAYGEKYNRVREFMAHHQGMIFLAMVNYFQSAIMVRRFQSDPRIRSVELLLQEQIPESAPLEELHVREGQATRSEAPRVATTPWQVPVFTPQPRVHYLTNGHYGVMINNVGGGYSTWNGIDLTRWRAETTLNNWGSWIYVQDMDAVEGVPESGLWSASYQPTAAKPQSQEVWFSPHMVMFRRRDGDISLTMEITISPEEDLEIRQVILTNHSAQPRRLRLVSYGEVVMASQETDARHPAFNKLFIESEYQPGDDTLIFRRRPRSEGESPVFLGHTLIVPPGTAVTGEFESDRAKFLGRGGSSRKPQALMQGGRLSGTAGATLDPIFSLAQEVTLPPHGAAQVAFLTAAGESRNAVRTILARYKARHLMRRAFEQARSQAEIQLRQLGLSSQQLERIEILLSFLVFPQRALRAGPDVLAQNSKGQPALWAYSISGDYPILLVTVSDADHLPLVFELLQAHAYWRSRDLRIDLVIMNEKGSDYGQEVSSGIYRMISRLHSSDWINRRGGIFILHADQIKSEDRVLLETAARVVLDSSKGQLARQLTGMNRMPARLPPIMPSLTEQPAGEIEPVAKPAGLRYENGYGGFTEDGSEYVIYLEKDSWTPLPWSNVIANPDFGTLVTETGGGYTWAVNSGENRLTPWSNDPVRDTHGEAIYLRDEETAEVWSPTPLPARAGAPYLIRHGAGYTVFEHNSHGLRQRLRVFVAPHAPVKILQLKLENGWQQSRRITATFYAEWVLGVTREASQQYVVSEYVTDPQALLAHNAYNHEFAGRVAFAAANRPLHGLTANRTEFLGRMGSRRQPAALKRIGLASTVQPGIDPCAALQLHLDLQPGEAQEVYFLLGQGEDEDSTLRLVKQFQEASAVEQAWQENQALWERVLGAVQVSTPDGALDLLLNRWLLYQALACRLWGRSAFYQSSGAYGFRDQLQDVMALAFCPPEITREQILRAASHQFVAGDVLHWWHPPTGRGVRTRISDDLLWLPYVTAVYIEQSGDVGILDERIPFIQGPLLQPGEDERYGQYETSATMLPLYEHCLRAIEKGSTFGPHSLPLFGTGDWNDGMNKVGAGGKGESIWLGWFLYDTLQRFAAACERYGKAEQAEELRLRAGKYQQALQKSAWDGAWYRRGYYDDGSPLGSASNRECKIDSIAQSWSVLSKGGDAERDKQAMQSLAKMLVKEEERLVLLLTPPFNYTPRNPGYIKGYLPGIRENGGQYTHAAIWAAWATVEMGSGNDAHALFDLLNPIQHADTNEKLERYKVEPYVVAADVYSVPPHTGRGGWTWYTGSAAWMYRLGVEAILGLKRMGDRFVVDPTIPPTWKSFQITVRDGGSEYQIQVENPQGVMHGVNQVLVDGKPVPDGKVLFVGDGKQHQVVVRMGEKQA